MVNQIPECLLRSMNLVTSEQLTSCSTVLQKELFVAPLPALLRVEQLERAGIFCSTRGQGIGAQRARRRCRVRYEDKEGRVWDSGCVTAQGQRT